jgi:ligand-binding sensor domain-containing protein
VVPAVPAPDAGSEPAASVTPAGPPPEKVTLAQLDASKVPVSGAPDWMADDGSNLFVKTDSGSVAVIDPDKSTEVRRLPLGAGGLCQGIGAGSGMVWSCDPNPSGTTDDVLRVNLKSGKAERFKIGKRPDQGHLDVAAGRVWLITDAGLVGLNVTTGQLDPPVDLGVPGTDLAATDQRAYVVSRGAGAIVSVDLTGRRVLAQANVTDARALAVSNEVWVVTGSELVALEEEGLKEIARIPIEGEPCSVAADGDRVFVIGTEPLLTEVDTTTHRVSRVVTDANSDAATYTLLSARSG